MAGYNRTLGKSLEAALRATQRAPVELTHQQRVTRLYRDALRTLDSWISDRAIWCDQTNKVRAQFDKYKHYPADSGAVRRVMREAEEQLFKFSHPDRYVSPYMPGGSKFMRNPPPPLDVVFPQGIPPEANIATQNIHSVQLPMTARPEGEQTLLVDIYKKTAS